MVNTVVLLADLSSDPELRYTAKGTAVCNLRLENHVEYEFQNGTKRTDHCYVDAVVWGRNAENCAEYLKKGSTVLLEGRLVTQEWQDRNGQLHTQLKVTASSVQFMRSSSAPKRENPTNEDVPF